MVEEGAVKVSPKNYASVARLSKLYLEAYEKYEATPRLLKPSQVATQELDELLCVLERAITPITFTQSLDFEAWLSQDLEKRGHHDQRSII